MPQAAFITGHPVILHQPISPEAGDQAASKSVSMKPPWLRLEPASDKTMRLPLRSPLEVELFHQIIHEKGHCLGIASAKSAQTQ